MPLDAQTYAAILARVADGELITDVCDDYGIARSTVWRYAEAGSEEDRNAYTRARTLQAHVLAEDTVRTSRSARGHDSDYVAAVRLEVDTMKWLTTKIAPRLYGDRLDVQAVVAHTVSGVIALPEEDTPLPRATATARLASSSDTLGDEPQAVDAPHVTPSDLAQHVNDGEGGGDGSGTGDA